MTGRMRKNRLPFPRLFFSVIYASPPALWKNLEITETSFVAFRSEGALQKGISAPRCSNTGSLAGDFLSRRAHKPRQGRFVADTRSEGLQSFVPMTVTCDGFART